MVVWDISSIMGTSRINRDFAEVMVKMSFWIKQSLHWSFSGNTWHVIIDREEAKTPHFLPVEAPPAGIYSKRIRFEKRVVE